MNETVVLVPGLYAPRVIMSLMAYRFRHLGYRTIILSNQYIKQTPAQNAERILLNLQRIEQERNSDTYHLLGHSLGGIVVMHMLALVNDQALQNRLPIGRVVLMAAPILGSAVAAKLYKRRWLRAFLGASVQQGLLGDVPLELNQREIGVISGSSRIGVSAMLFKPSNAVEANDGVVSRSETELKGACGAVCIPQSHSLMLFSRLSVDKAASFFKQGRFE